VDRTVGRVAKTERHRFRRTNNQLMMLMLHAVFTTAVSTADGNGVTAITTKSAIGFLRRCFVVLIVRNRRTHQHVKLIVEGRWDSL